MKVAASDGDRKDVEGKRGQDNFEMAWWYVRENYVTYLNRRRRAIVASSRLRAMRKFDPVVVVLLPD